MTSSSASSSLVPGYISIKLEWSCWVLGMVVVGSNNSKTIKQEFNSDKIFLFLFFSSTTTLLLKTNLYAFCLCAMSACLVSGLGLIPRTVLALLGQGSLVDGICGVRAIMPSEGVTVEVRGLNTLLYTGPRLDKELWLRILFSNWPWLIGSDSYLTRVSAHESNKLNNGIIKLFAHSCPDSWTVQECQWTMSIYKCIPGHSLFYKYTRSLCPCTPFPSLHPMSTVVTCVLEELHYSLVSGHNWEPMNTLINLDDRRLFVTVL